MRISDWSSDVCSSDLRGSYDTAFRAPELHHLYAGQGSVDSGGIDYYRCATEQPDVPFEDCDFSNEGFQLDRSGDMTLEPETDRKSVVSGKSGAVSVALGGCRNIKKQNKT